MGNTHPLHTRNQNDFNVILFEKFIPSIYLGYARYMPSQGIYLGYPRNMPCLNFLGFQMMGPSPSWEKCWGGWHGPGHSGKRLHGPVARPTCSGCLLWTWGWRRTQVQPVLLLKSQHRGSYPRRRHAPASVRSCRD